MALSFWKGVMGFFGNKSHEPISANKRSPYIFYKIVEADDDGPHFMLQCVNTSVTLWADILEIVLDRKILSSLHPVQSCFIGIEYSKYLHSHKEALKKNAQLRTESYLLHRYGIYRIVYQDRNGNLCFVCSESKKEYLMDPRDIALSRELIEEFDAVQAFYIGYLAGLKLRNPVNRPQSIGSQIPPYLKVVK